MGSIIGVARRTYVSGEWLSVDYDALRRYVSYLGQGKPPSWQWYLPKGKEAVEDVFFEFCFNAAQNGGYYYRDDVGDVRQWEVNGSGSRALMAWIEGLRANGLFPGLDITDPARVAVALVQSLKGIPYAKERIGVARRFAMPSVRQDLKVLLHGAYQPDGVWVFGEDQVANLQKIIPEGFGHDPFAKKAILAFMLMTGWLQNKGYTVAFNLPVAADYQLPRALVYLGILKPTDEYLAEVNGGKLVSPTFSHVAQARGATVIVCREIAERAGVADHIVDAALFTRVREAKDFAEKTPAPFKIDNMWF